MPEQPALRALEVLCAGGVIYCLAELTIHDRQRLRKEQLRSAERKQPLHCEHCGPQPLLSAHCGACAVCIPGRCHHCGLFACCVGTHSRVPYCALNALGAIALVPPAIGTLRVIADDCVPGIVGAWSSRRTSRRPR